MSDGTRNLSRRDFVKASVASMAVIASARPVRASEQGGIRLGGIHLGIRRGIDKQIGARVRNHPIDLIGIGEISFRDIDADAITGVARRLPHDLPSQLAVCSG